MSVAVGAVLARGAETSSSELCLKRGLETTISESGTDPGRDPAPREGPRPGARDFASDSLRDLAEATSLT